MKKVWIPMLLVLFLGVSCSSGKKDAEKKETAQVKGADDFIVDSDEQDLFLEDESAKPEAAKPEAAKAVMEEKDVMLAQEEPMPTQAPVIGEGAGCMTSTYTIQKGETLMQIAFKLYGDYRRWKEIAQMNPSINGKGIRAGKMLSYCSGQELTWQPQGNPYIIRLGDTLGTISNDKYQTPKRWKEIWNNNKPLIHDPNKIYAGFTIYYIPDEVANL